MFKVNNRNTRTRREICSKLTIKTAEPRRWRCFTPCSSVAMVNFEQVNVSWVDKYETESFPNKQRLDEFSASYLIHMHPF